MNIEQPSIRQQARALKLSPAQVHTLRRRGMPAAIEAARAWRKANICALKGKTATQLPQLSEDLREAKQRTKGGLPDSLAEAEGIFRDLETATETATARAAQLTGNSSPAIDELGRRWSVVAADLLKRKLEVIERVQALRVQSGELVVYAEMRDTFTSFLKEVRTLASTMPAAMAMRCNPVDPQLAQAALEDWLKGFFRQLHQHPAKADAGESEGAPSKI
jgi:hypothetical protein